MIIDDKLVRMNFKNQPLKSTTFLRFLSPFVSKFVSSFLNLFTLVCAKTHPRIEQVLEPPSVRKTHFNFNIRFRPE